MSHAAGIEPPLSAPGRILLAQLREATARRDLPAARGFAERLWALHPDSLLAALLLGNELARAGDRDACLDTLVAALARAERNSLLLRDARLADGTRELLPGAISLVQRARADALAPAWQQLVARHGEPALERIGAALARHLGQARFEPASPLQKPSFLFVPGLPDQPWFERGQFPFLAEIEAHTGAIRAELEAVLDEEHGVQPYVDMPEGAPATPAWRALNGSTQWSSYHLFRHGLPVDANARRCPRTIAALEALPIMRIPDHAPEAMFSILRPQTRIPPHTGVINGRLIVHLPLVVPPQCGALRVGGLARAWREGECLVFDDSYVHEAWNDSAQTRVVLIFDIWHPDLTDAERDAMATMIGAIGAFNRRHGGTAAPLHA